MRLGLDFGTTNSSIARYADGALSQVRLDAINDNPHVLPSLVYVDRSYDSLVGTEAALEYLKRETGRPVRWEKRHLGEIEVVAADNLHFLQYVHVMMDVAANGRLLQSIKTGLRDRTYDGTQIFDRFYTLDELIALILDPLKQKAEAQLGEACDSVVIGRPVRFANSPELTRRAEEILFRAAVFAGFGDIRFELEPVGVAHLYHRTTAERGIALIFDFGGGTLDLAVAEVGGSASPRILATQGVMVGGDDLDRRIMESLFRHFGAESTTTEGRPFPSQVLESLSGWQTMPDLTRPQNRTLLSDLKRTSRHPKAIAALETLVSRNLGFGLFQEIERAKKRLSAQSVTRLDFAYGDINIHEVITRGQFEAMISQETRAVYGAVLQIPAVAGWLRQVDTVLRTGGTSAVPAFTRILAAIFGEGKVRAMDMLTSVVGGLSVVAHDDAGSSAPFAETYTAPLGSLVNQVHAGSDRQYESYRIRIGARCYTDWPCTWTRAPVDLSGLPAIRTASSDSVAAQEEFLQFTLTRASRVYVAHDARALSIPDWLLPYTREDAAVEVDDWGTTGVFQLFSREFPAGTVVLGGNQATGYRGGVTLNYLVAVRPTSQ